MKTCYLVPGLVNKARLLFQRHSITFENEYERTTSVAEFVRQHNGIDKNIKSEMNWSKMVTMAFVIVDIVVTVLIVGSFGVLQYEKIYHVGTLQDNAYLILEFLAPVLDVVIALILVFSALYLAKSLRSSTGRRPNICLLSWHIANLFVLISMVIASGFYYDKWVHAPPEDFLKFWY